MAEMLRVLQVGLGPMGLAVTRTLAARPGLVLAGAVDRDPALAGRDAGELAGLAPLGARVMGDLAAAVAALRPRAAIVTTRSRLAEVADDLALLAAAGISAVSTAEELAWPWSRPAAAARLDEAARRGRAALLGTGVNPGFLMDLWPLACSAVCRRVDSLAVWRVQDAASRRVPFQRKIGAGLAPAEFARRWAARDLGHVGLEESLRLLASRFGWPLDEVAETAEPLLADSPIAGPVPVAAGQARGLTQVGRGISGGRERLRLTFVAGLGEREPRDELAFAGDPPLRVVIPGGVNGDVATAAIAVNALAAVLAAPPGLHSVDRLPVPAYREGGFG